MKTIYREEALRRDLQRVKSKLATRSRSVERLRAALAEKDREIERLHRELGGGWEAVRAVGGEAVRRMPPEHDPKIGDYIRAALAPQGEGA